MQGPGAKAQSLSYSGMWPMYCASCGALIKGDKQYCDLCFAHVAKAARAPATPVRRGRRLGVLVAIAVLVVVGIAVGVWFAVGDDDASEPVPQLDR